jgi:hypothetical protein
MSDVAKIRCPYCDVEIRANAAQCWMCRGDLENGQVVIPARARTRQPSPLGRRQSNRFVHRVSHGDGGSTFRGLRQQHGTSLVMSDAANTTCPYCTAEIRPNAFRCWMCQGELRDRGLPTTEFFERLAGFFFSVASVVAGMCLATLALFIAFFAVCSLKVSQL